MTFLSPFNSVKRLSTLLLALKVSIYTVLCPFRLTKGTGGTLHMWVTFPPMHSCPDKGLQPLGVGLWEKDLQYICLVGCWGSSRETQLLLDLRVLTGNGLIGKL